MRVTEPWDPLGRYFVRDLVDDLFDEGHGFRERAMTERTNEELADWIRGVIRMARAKTGPAGEEPPTEDELTAYAMTHNVARRLREQASTGPRVNPAMAGSSEPSPKGGAGSVGAEGERIEGWAHTHGGMENGAYHFGPRSYDWNQSATLILHPQEPESDEK